MSVGERLERCHECGSSVEVYVTICAACGANLFEAKVKTFRELRDGGGMMPEAFEVAVELLRKGPVESPEVAGGSERKEVTDLTLADLVRCSVWEFALDEEGERNQDEETVKPRNDVDAVDPAKGLFVIAARFTAADGTELAGYVTPSNSGERAEAPTVVTEAGEQVSFWHGITKPNRVELEAAYRTLGRNAAELFPLRVEARVPTTAGALVDEIRGFGYYERWPEARAVT